MNSEADFLIDFLFLFGLTRISRIFLFVASSVVLRTPGLTFTLWNYCCVTKKVGMLRFLRIRDSFMIGKLPLNFDIDILRDLTASWVESTRERSLLWASSLLVTEEVRSQKL